MNAASQLKPFRGAMLNRTHPLARGLVGCWIFNEGSGSMVYDLSGYGNHGTMQNMNPATDWVGGKHGWALDFDGSNDCVDAGNADNLALINNLTVSVWVYPKATASGNTYILSRRAISFGYNICFSADGSIRVVDGAGYFRTTGWDYTVSQWQHLVLVIQPSGTEFIMYKNGVSGGIRTMSIYSTNTNNTIIGARSTGAGWANAIIDGAHIYNRALSAEEVEWLNSQPFCMFEEPTPRAVFIMPELEAPLDLVNVAATLHTIEYNIELSIY